MNTASIELQTIAINLKRLRTARGLSQDGLAQGSKVSARSVMRIEAGRSVQGETLVLVAKFLSVTLEDITKNSFPEAESGKDRN